MARNGWDGFLRGDLKALWKFLAFAVVIILLDFLVENINGRFWLNDFKVYYLAAKALLTDQQVYGVPFGLSSGFYKYSPFTLFFVFPYCVVPFETARVIHFFVLGLIIISVFFVIRAVYRDYYPYKATKSENLILSLSFIAVLIHFVKELHLGNINVALLLLLCLSLYMMLKSRWVLAGILFTMAILTKPFFLILILPLIFRKKWNVLASAGGTLIVAFLLPGLFFGFLKNFQLHLEWISTMFAHNANYPGHHSIQCLIQYYINPNVPNAFQYVIILGGGLLFLVVHYFNRISEKKQGDTVIVQNSGLIFEWFLLIAVLPSLVKTDSEHFLASLPLIMLIIYYLFKIKQIIPTLAFIVLIFFYGANSNDLLGTELCDIFYDHGDIGISNLLLIAFAIFVFFKRDQGIVNLNDSRKQ